MTESHAQRTLVKSPPELWAELSDPAALARHLAEIDGGEIRITRLEPEKTVVWEGDHARGRVELKQSAWGTTVTLSLTHAEEVEPPAPDLVTEMPVVEADVVAVGDPEAVAEPEPEAVAQVAEVEPARPAPVIEVEPARPAPVIEVEVEPVAEETDEDDDRPISVVLAAAALMPEATARRSFLTRWLDRWRARQETPAPTPEPELSGLARPASTLDADATVEPASDAVAAPEPTAAAAPDPALSDKPEPTVAADAEAADASPPDTDAVASGLDSERAVELLSSVLDSLGSAHHRPFSRS